MTKLLIVPPEIKDLADILSLYQTVANVEGGLARAQCEITEEYVRHNFLASRERGLSLIARTGQTSSAKFIVIARFRKCFHTGCLI